MKKILFLITFCLASITVKSQNIEALKKQNTIFILFEEGKFSKKEKLIPKIQQVISYTFYYNKENSVETTLYSFMLYFQKYKNYQDAMNNMNQTMVYKVHKSFLRKNKDIIITKKFIDFIGEAKTVSLLNGNNNHVFIIDKSEIEGNQILIRKVIFHNSPVDSL